MATFYVNNTMSSSGNGTSWSSAWNSFSDIDWDALKPGDTVQVSGGTYRETLDVDQSGSAGKPITIKASDEAGHNGAVIIDGENERSNGVVVRDHDHVKIDGFDIRNHAASGVSVRDATAGVVIENNSVYSGDPGNGNARGYDVRNSSGENAVIVRNNSFSTPRDTDAQTDGIWSSANDGVVFDGNRIVISNNSTRGHSDGIQSHLDYNVTFRNNHIEQANEAATDNHGMWLAETRPGGTLKVYNNVVYTPNLTRDSAVTHLQSDGSDDTGAIQFWGNTVYGGRQSLNLANSANADIKNNILVPLDGGYGVVFHDEAASAGNVKGNLVWAPDGHIVWMDGTWSMAEWQKDGYNLGGLSADPKLVKPSSGDLHQTSASPGIDEGVTLAALTADKAGTPRPQGGGHDIGAYEFKAAAVPATAAAQDALWSGQEDGLHTDPALAMHQDYAAFV